VLSDRELAALRDLERQLRWGSPELFRLFESVQPQQTKDHPKRTRARVLMAGAALMGLALLGPRVLDEAEVRTRRRRPLPCTAPADSTNTRRTGPASGTAAAATIPVGLMSLFLGPSTIVALSSRHDPCAEDGPGRFLGRGPEHVESLCREA
jgi:hypothetical protein